MKKILLVAGLVLLSGCSNIQTILNNDTSKDPTKETSKKKKTVKVVNYSCDDGAGTTITFEAKGDNMTSMKQVSLVSYSDMGIEITEDMDKDTIQQKINDALNNKYEYVDGVECTGTLHDDKVEIVTKIDFTKADKDELVDVGLLDQAEKENHVVSLKKTIKAYEANNYACQEQ